MAAACSTTNITNVTNTGPDGGADADHDAAESPGQSDAAPDGFVADDAASSDASVGGVEAAITEATHETMRVAEFSQMKIVIRRSRATRVRHGGSLLRLRFRFRAFTSADEPNRRVDGAAPDSAAACASRTPC
jgi:hypothetical protein